MKRPLRNAIDTALGRWLILAQLALVWESFWHLTWPLVSLTFLFLALALFDVFPLLPGWLHSLVLAAFAIAAVLCLIRLRHLRLPARNAILRRIERDSGPPHQPLQAMQDQQVSGLDDSLSRALWQRHREATSNLLDRVSVNVPISNLAHDDPIGLRFVALILFGLAIVGAWGEMPDRLQRAVVPNIDWLIGPAPVLQVWVTPPSYTRIAPMLLESLPSGQAVRLPTGSKLLAELQGGRGQAKFELDDKSEDFNVLSAGSQRFETTVKAGGSLEIHQGWRSVAHWNLDVAADHPPSIEFSDRPKTDIQGRIQFGILAKDDYGLAKAWLTVHRSDKADAPPRRIELPLADHGTNVRQTFWEDMTSDPWAGIGVTVWPEATDEAGQKGIGEAMQIILPEHRFTNPVARAIIALRRALVLNPESRAPVGLGLYGIAAQPQAFNNDLTVALGLSSAIGRLRHDSSNDAIPGIVDLLWQIAMRIEDGDKPEAAKSVADAKQALEKALAQNAPEAEIERLTKELQAAIQRYMQALTADAIKHGQIVTPKPGDRVITSDDIRKMLDKMRDLSQIGARDAARKMLDQLGQMMDQMDAAASPQPSRKISPEEQRQLDALASITRDQRQLLENTQKRMDAQPGNTSAAAPKPGDQEALRQRLGQVMQGLGDLGASIPDNLGKAEMAMRNAGRGLRNGAFNQAAQAEAEALAQLEQGAKEAQSSMSQGSSGGVALTPGPGGGNGIDPLGRPLNGTGTADDESVKIPDQADVQKSREVLDEIRRRAGQVDRPPAEHDYLDRLLRQLY